MPPPFSVSESLFFVTLIAVMALAPLINKGWWVKWYPWVTLAVALPCAVDVGIKNPGELYLVGGEYISFILLIGALYIVSGGIDVEIPACGRPGSNVLILLAGACLANVLGTTGASVILIRPLLRANGWRRHITHLYVFFIFMVSNIGGMLTPLGDPPLFLGYLQGVPFFWTFKLFPVWCASAGILAGAFWLLDSWQFRKEDGFDHEAPARRLQIRGIRNILLLLVVITALFLPHGVREIAMVLAIGVSIRVTPRAIRERNDFTYHPIIEVAVLFAGIFVTMIPLQSLLRTAGSMGIGASNAAIFWMVGGLSSCLDNAPTYLIFFEAGKTTLGSLAILVSGGAGSMLGAISLGCVMMGANTYIGNGPNLMVKAICEDEGVAMPSFLGYMLWSGCVLIPLYGFITWWLWL